MWSPYPLQEASHWLKGLQPCGRIIDDCGANQLLELLLPDGIGASSGVGTAARRINRPLTTRQDPSPSLRLKEMTQGVETKSKTDVSSHMSVDESHFRHQSGKAGVGTKRIELWLDLEVNELGGAFRISSFEPFEGPILVS